MESEDESYRVIESEEEFRVSHGVGMSIYIEGGYMELGDRR